MQSLPLPTGNPNMLLLPDYGQCSAAAALLLLLLLRSTPLMLLLLLLLPQPSMTFNNLQAVTSKTHE